MRIGFRLLWRRHVILGVPLAAFLHSVLQFAYQTYDWVRNLWVFPFHFLAGCVFGSVILVPAYSLQALLFHLLTRWRIREPVVVVLCGAFQAGLVALWAFKVGIQPSLAGNFELAPPMIGAGFIAGAVVALNAIALVRRQAAKA